MYKEYLNTEQLATLKDKHPDNNKVSFMDRISKITVTPETSSQILVAFDKYDVHCKLLLKDNK